MAVVVTGVNLASFADVLPGVRTLPTESLVAADGTELRRFRAAGGRR